MTELSEIYLALKNRISTLEKTTDEKDLEMELRLDIETVLDLLSKELGILLFKNK